MNDCQVLDCRQLKIFLAVWEQKNISKAAKKLNLSQPTVSAHLKTLEDQLGVRLFDRTSRTVEPTVAAKVLYPHARRIIRLNRTALDEIAALLGNSAGHLEVGASNIPGQYLLPGLLARFKANRAGVKVSLKIADTLEVTKQVDAGAVEIGFVGARVENRRLEFEECFDDELIFVVGNGHELAGQEAIGLDEILEQPLVIREKGSGSRMTVEAALRQKGLNVGKMKVLMELGSTEALRQAVKAGVGCAFISRRAVADDIACGLLQEVKIEGLKIKRRFYLCWSLNRTLSPLASAFVGFVSEINPKKE
ncbi:MAG: LysR family transcriptional regulator [Thermodesulfobacteria bacterium]|nr:LysR family transcriptional regulator [Thermodesulfobacteriota bacterium]